MGEAEATSLRLMELEAVNDVLVRATRLDLDGVFDTAVDRFHALTTASSTTLRILDPETGTLSLSAIRYDPALGPAYEAEQRSRLLHVGEGLIGLATQHRTPLLVDDVAAHPRATNRPDATGRQRSAIVVPLEAEGELLGVIRAIKPGLASFTPHQFAVAQALARVTALTVLTVRGRHELAQRAAEFELLYDASVKLSNATDLTEALDAVVESGVRLVGGDAGVVFGREEARFIPLASTPNVDRATLARRSPRGRVTAQLLATRESVIVPDVAAAGLMEWAREIGMHSVVGVPLRREGVVLGALWVAHRHPGFFSNDHARRLSVLALQAASALSRAESFAEAQRMAVTDELTGLFNARYFTARLNEEIARAERTERPVSLMLLDSDSLKAVNDAYGHLEGDRALIALAADVRRLARSSDVAVRLGGDEFVLLQPETDLRGALDSAERVRSAISSRSFRTLDGRAMRVTVSAGVASFPACAESATDLVRVADEALYRAKREGKDRVVAAPSRRADRS
ncbi:MAG: diguanylate cyclase [Chloroflexota bacterium]|nr:diguanylate cyclase [Chloroflexota bacterium]